MQFLRRAVDDTSIAKRPVPKWPGVETVRILVNGEISVPPVDQQALPRILSELAIDDFVIIERGEQTYIQVLSRLDDFIVETREGAADRHFRTTVHKGSQGEFLQYGDAVNEVLAMLATFVAQEGRSQHVLWERIAV